MLDRHRENLQALADSHRLRRLAPRAGIDFASNDYLALSGAPVLVEAVHAALDRGVPVGSGGSRLLRGNHPEHEALEAEAAAFFGCERALYFSSGYAANNAILGTLPQSGDLIVHDELIHASSHEGMRLSRADATAARHNDAQAFEDAILRWRNAGGAGAPWIAVESLYSMDGDKAPLAELMGIADRHGGFLVIDEAHATGVFGPDGRGLGHICAGRDNVVLLYTCGKALACEGALVAAPKVLIDFLVNRGRQFIFSTAPSPLMAAAVRAALRVLADEPERRERLSALSAHAARRFGERLGTPPSGSQILPVILGDDARTMAAATELQARGFDVRGIRPPTVPEGTSRLRVSLTLHADSRAVDDLVEALADILAHVPA